MMGMINDYRVFTYLIYCKLSDLTLSKFYCNSFLFFLFLLFKFLILFICYLLRKFSVIHLNLHFNNIAQISFHISNLFKEKDYYIYLKNIFRLYLFKE